ncbi:MAG: type II toxin-antitoxin system VapC family toxin [Gemmataceae bacterium]|nr:type II toxin-antitoxin system VapC family toxin [Gemmataceae bacterium]
MPRFLLDSGIASDYVDRRNGVYDRARAETLRGNRVGTAVPVLAELVSGIERSSSRERNLRALQLVLGAWRLWPFDEAAAFEYGRLHAELYRLGRPMQVIDVMIAAVALSLGNTVVVTTDSDLTAVPGLTVENWTA